MNTSGSTLIFRVCILLLVLVIIDLYSYRSIKTAFSFLQSERTKQIIYWLYWTVNILFISTTVYVLTKFDRHAGPRGGLFTFLIGAFVLLYIPKLVLVIFLLLEDVFRVLRAGGVSVGKMVSNTFSDTPFFEARRKFISQIGLALASFPFFSILYGINKGKYNFKVHRVTLKFKDLPDAFNGLTITQISDIHSGSFDSEKDVKRGIDLVNEQKSDLIFFTGDLVNNLANEMLPWIPLFKQLKAPMGVYSILGNHDYGDYSTWDSEEEKKRNHDHLKEIQKELGFRLMLNENTSLEKDGQKISLIGMENWGNGSFTKYGDLEKSLIGVPEDSFKILLSHDPSHWDAKTLHNPTMIHLTLSGHTHGMQFGVEIPGFRWSPVQYRYPRWAGLYEADNRYLYVNRGFGFIGFPGRVGIWPEITVITLQKA
jgi:predicted MPP superfamily phosphohydrolase